MKKKKIRIPHKLIMLCLVAVSPINGGAYLWKLKEMNDPIVITALDNLN